MEEVLTHNMTQIEAFFSSLNPCFYTYVYTERRTWNDTQMDWLKETLWNVQMIKFWEDEGLEVKQEEDRIAQQVRTTLNCSSYHEFMPRMWFRRARLFDHFVRNKGTESFDLVLQARLFDTKIDMIRPCPSLEPNTLYHSADTLFYGEHQVIGRLLLFGRLCDQICTKSIDYKKEPFATMFRLYDKLLCDIRPTHSSEVQIWHYIIRNFKHVNLRDNITAPHLSPDAYLKVRLYR